ncbi:hypothetical protein TNCV_3430461 [Trichonephila clavipes]|nr:hypothetical protein TNCV_3430461 [Trichonephila clavipes]
MEGRSTGVPPFDKSLGRNHRLVVGEGRSVDTSKLLSESAQPPSVREEYVVLFEDYSEPFGHSAHSWVSKRQVVL